MSLQPQTQTQTARGTATTKVVAPDFIVMAKKADEAILGSAEKNPVYQCIFEGNMDKEQRIAKVVAYLTAGLQDGTAKTEDLDQRRQNLSQLNAAIQVLRKQLGSDQAKEITSKAYADFQRIVNETSTDVAGFQDELAPLCQLAELFSTYGADGNIIEKINQAKEQKKQREARQRTWQDTNEAKVRAFRQSVSTLQATIQADQMKLDRAWIGQAAIRARIANAEADLEIRQKELAAAQAEVFEDASTPASADVAPINEEILELQNIGGEKFKAAVTELRDHTEAALAKISINFDEAVTGLTNARESFIAMDRNCGDATFALSVLEVAVQQAESMSRSVAENTVKTDTAASTGAMADLDRMEREQRADQVLNYTASLTTFMKDVGVAVASLRSGQAVIKTILRMNSLALESANTHKITGIANTADAVTITIGSIIEVCNRAASRALADGLTRMRGLAEEGSARLIGGSYEALKQQNEQLADFNTTVANLRSMTKDITANTVDLLKEQFDLVAKMKDESAQLGEATTDAERSAFAARAGTGDVKKKEEAPPTRRFGGMRMPGQ
jgi:hypothetical protein